MEISFSIFNFQLSIVLNGVYSDGDPPLPIPNREVKPVSADGTAERWESRSMPDFQITDILSVIYGEVAQLVRAHDS